MDEHSHTQDEPREPAVGPETGVDAGSQALSEALRSSFGIVKFVMALLLLIFLGSGIFIVKQQERALILHFGKPVGQGERALLQPGLHFSWPYPIDDHVIVSISGVQQLTSTVGWFAVTPEQEVNKIEPPAGPTLNPAVDGYVLTADNNIIHSKATLTYHVADPVGYIFNFKDASNAVLNAVNNALLYTAAQFKVDDILMRDQVGFKAAVRKRIEQLVEQQNLGIAVESCQVDSRPPRQLKEAFASVLKAELDRSALLNKAHTDENQLLSQASAEAKTLVNKAESERAQLTNDVNAEVNRFSTLLPKFNENRDLFVQRFLTEALSRALPQVQAKIFVTEQADAPKEVRLLLNQEQPKKADESKP